MPYQSRLSSKGQITIPIEVRVRLGLEPGDVVVYEIEGEQAILRRSHPLDVEFHTALPRTLGEWSSAEDDEAFRNL